MSVNQDQRENMDDDRGSERPNTGGVQTIEIVNEVRAPAKKRVGRGVRRRNPLAAEEAIEVEESHGD